MKSSNNSIRYRSDFPYEITEIENTWIPLSDGCQLAARIWLPANAEEQPVPAILEYIPYRKNDLTAPRDSIRMPYFAGHGYASIRVDMRGSGDSDGLLLDEYLPQEQHDALEVLTWIASQSWCSGKVGIIGISWGGFNGLQIAAHNPPELGAVITLCSTDDRYADDVHYMGGCIVGSEVLNWASIMLALNALPPDPEHVGERWREMWMNRLENTPPFVHEWIRHQRRDEFWKQGSVCEDYDAIRCPVYAVGGWADGYTNAIPRLLEGLQVPRKGLIGPWAHSYPNDAKPGPSIGFLQECLRWWDYWLKGIETGIMDEPMLRVWMQDSVPPRPSYPIRPGRWVAEKTWPAPDIEKRNFWFGEHVLQDYASVTSPWMVPSSEICGLHAGVWCPYGEPGDFADDQSPEDAFSLAFTSVPLAEPLEILGFPEVSLEIAADRPDAQVAVRLCDVAPDGSSTLVTRGFLNLTHRESHENPIPVKPGERMVVSVQMHAIAHSFSSGHCIRLAISSTYWPQVWPSPELVELELFPGEASRLSLPVRTPKPQDGQLLEFGEPEGSPPLEKVQIRAPARSREVCQDVIQQTFELVDRTDEGIYRLLSNGIETEGILIDTFRITRGKPLSAMVCSERVYAISRGEWRTRVETVSTMTADAEKFHITNQVQAFENEIRVFAKNWHISIARDHV